MGNKKFRNSGIANPSTSYYEKICIKGTIIKNIGNTIHQPC